MDAMGFRGMGCFGWRERHGRDPNKHVAFGSQQTVVFFFGKDYQFLLFVVVFAVDDVDDFVVVVVVVAAVRRRHFQPYFVKSSGFDFGPNHFRVFSTQQT